VLYTVFIESKTRDPELWNMLKKCLRSLRNRENVVILWDNVLFGLTNRLLRILWSDHGKDELVIEWSGSSTMHSIAEDDVIFFWYQVLNLMGNPNVIENPVSHWYAVQAYSKVADMFNDVGGIIKNDVVDDQSRGTADSTPAASRRYRLFSSFFSNNYLTNFITVIVW
jgi:hypothetical protein